VSQVPASTVDLSSPEAVRKHIFNKTYLYAIPGYYRYSKEYNKTVGHLDTGSKALNQAVMNEYVDIGGTIEDILRLYEKGADIKMRDGKDLVTIYEVLTAHLHFWARHVNNDPNVKNAPLESLYLMSDYCQTIQNQVKGFKPKVQDVPHLKRVSALFGMGEGIAELFNPTGVGAIVEDTGAAMNSIEQMLAERKKGR
jgi:hypothetical protein